MRISSVRFDLFLRLLTLKPGWARAVSTLLHLSQHSRQHNEWFVRDLVKAGSFGFVEDAVEHVGLFFFVKRAGAHR